VFGTADGLVVVVCAQAGSATTMPAATANAFRVCFIFQQPRISTKAAAHSHYAAAGFKRLNSDFVHWMH
jgi:hypothetical protein